MTGAVRRGDVHRGRLLAGSCHPLKEMNSVFRTWWYILTVNEPAGHKGFVTATWAATYTRHVRTKQVKDRELVSCIIHVTI